MKFIGEKSGQAVQIGKDIERLLENERAAKNSLVVIKEFDAHMDFSERGRERRARRREPQRWSRMSEQERSEYLTAMPIDADQADVNTMKVR